MQRMLFMMSALLLPTPPAFAQMTGIAPFAQVDPAFERPEDRVAAAMRLDTFQIEAMTTDATTMDYNRWQPSLERRKKILPAIRRILSLTENEIDIWNVSMTLAKDAYPDLDVERYDREFNEVVERIRRATPPDADPERRIRTMNTIIYRKMGVAYDKEDLESQKLINRYAVGVLKTNRGSCVSLELFYLAIAQRLRYPIYPAAAPQHLFARYVDPALKMQNIDPSGRGNFFPDEDYVRRLGIPARAIENGTYLRTFSYQELAGFMVADHGAFFYGDTLKDLPLGIAILERGLDHSQNNSEYWYNLGQLYNHWAQQEISPEIRETKSIRAAVFIQKGRRMGIGKPNEQESKKFRQLNEKKNAPEA